MIEPRPLAGLGESFPDPQFRATPLQTPNDRFKPTTALSVRSGSLMVIIITTNHHHHHHVIIIIIIIVVVGNFVTIHILFHIAVTISNLRFLNHELLVLIMLVITRVIIEYC